MKVFFHLGMHKTGSSLLQQRIFPKMEEVYYIPRSGSSALKKYILFTDDFEFDPIKGREIFNEIENIQKFRSVVISDEEFYGNPYWSNMDRKRNIDRIVAIFNGQVGFILFIRNQFSLINSLYNQYVKTGGTADLNSFLNFQKFPLYVNVGYFCFDKYIDYIHTKVGEENFKLYLFEGFLKNKLEVTREILSFMGNKDLILNESDFSLTNPSLKNNFIPLLRVVNKFTKNSKNPFNWLNRYVQVVFRKLFCMLKKLPLEEKKFKFNNEETISLIRKSNQRLHKKYNLDLDKYNYPQ